MDAQILDKFHLMKSDKTYVGFHIPTSKILRLNYLSYNIMSDLLNGSNKNFLSEKYKITVADISNFIKSITKTVSSPDTKKRKDPNIRIIDRLTIHVSNECNMACSYCYGGGGLYNDREKLMTEKTADDLVNYFTNEFDKINQIVFFGGEPLLNYRIIRRICLNFKKTKSRFGLPIFSIITNGTILNKEIIELINNYLKIVVVSIDGPKEANDLHRKFKGGKGSFERIDNFIKNIKEETNTIIQTESTYTKGHLKLGYKPKDISEYLNKRYDTQGVIVNEMVKDSMEERKNLMPNKEWVRRSLFVSEGESDYLNHDLNSIVLDIARGKKREMCPAGKNVIAINTEGEFYICHVLLNKTKYNLGSIYSENIFSNGEKYQKKFPFLETSLKEIKPCIDCWVKNLCGGCILHWFYDFKKEKFLSNPQPELCKSSREFFKDIIINLAELQKDDKAYNRFLDLIKKNLRPKIC